MSHEDFSPKTEARVSSDRAFGGVFAGVFALLGLWPLVHSSAPRWWALVVALAFALLALAAPRTLSPLNKVWTKLGALLHAIVSPVVLAVIFYGVVLPTSIVMRLRKRDALRLRFDPRASTYWVDRVPPGPAPQSFTDPF